MAIWLTKNRLGWSDKTLAGGVAGGSPAGLDHSINEAATALLMAAQARKKDGGDGNNDTFQPFSDNSIRARKKIVDAMVVMAKCAYGADAARLPKGEREKFAAIFVTSKHWRKLGGHARVACATTLMLG
jgi:hypothetical protein